jgi:hypothetical protein
MATKSLGRRHRCFCEYYHLVFSIRNNNKKQWQLMAADYAFIVGLITLMTSVCAAAISLLSVVRVFETTGWLN